MAVFVSVDEGYSVSRLNNIACVVRTCDSFVSKDGKKITKSMASKMLKDEGTIRCYSYTDDELEEAKENGGVLGVDWALKIVAL